MRTLRRIGLAVLACAGSSLIVWSAMTVAPAHAGYVIALSVGIALFAAAVSAGMSLHADLPKPTLKPAVDDEVLKLHLHLAKLDDRGHWARGAFRSALMWLIQGISDAAEHSATICKGVDGEIPLKFPVPGEVADRLLASTMKLLARDDRYYAVSNAAIWLTLKDFEASQEIAVRKGAAIQRVFVIDDSTDNSVSVEDISRVISEHDAYTRHWTGGGRGGGYEIRAVTREQYNDIARELSKMLHFGVFYPASSTRLPVAFKVVKEDLSEFRVSTAAKTSPYIAEFQRLWRSAKPLSDPETRYQFRLHLFRRMSPGGRYLAVCTVDGWRERKRAMFHREMIEIAKERDLKIQRIFIPSSNLTEEEMTALFHDETILADSSNGHYEWRRGHAKSAPSVSEGRSMVAYDEGKTKPGKPAAEIAHMDHNALIEESSLSGTLTADQFDDQWHDANK